MCVESSITALLTWNHMVSTQCANSTPIHGIPRLDVDSPSCLPEYLAIQIPQRGINRKLEDGNPEKRLVPSIPNNDPIPHTTSFQDPRAPSKFRESFTGKAQKGKTVPCAPRTRPSSPGLLPLTPDNANQWHHALPAAESLALLLTPVYIEHSAMRYRLLVLLSHLFRGFFFLVSISIIHHLSC